MTKLDPSRENRVADDSVDGDDRDGCVRYLLGALSVSERADFERRLESSRELVAELTHCATLVVELEQALNSSEASCNASLALPSNPARREVVFSVRMGWLAAAASLLVMLACWRGLLAPANRADEELLIAQAWASTSVAVESESPALDETRVDDWFDSTSSDDDPASLDLESEQIPEWLLVAVLADAEETGLPAPMSGRERSDG